MTDRFEIKTKVIGNGQREEAEARVLNRMIRITDEGWEHEPDQRHAELIISGLRLEGAKAVGTPGENELRRIWSDPGTRRRLLDNLAEEGFAEDQMTEMKKLISAERSDLFDVLAYVAYATPPITREQRALMAAESLVDEFGDNEAAFLEFVLGHYVEQGVTELDSSKLPQLLELKYDSMADAVPVLGAPSRIREMFVGFQHLLYAKVQAA